MHKQKKTIETNKNRIRRIDPFLDRPSNDIEQNVAEGIDEIIPDPSDVPGGVNPDLTTRWDIVESIVHALHEKNEISQTPQKSKK